MSLSLKTRKPVVLPTENPCHYGWDIAQIRGEKWIPVIQGIHDPELPVSERIRLAKKVLRSDYRLAWYMVMALYNFIETQERWGQVDNWLKVLSGPLRLKSIQVLQAPAGYDGATWDMAMMVLCDCCKAKDAPTILYHMRLRPGGPIGMHWAALHRIVDWKPEQDYPEIFDYCAELLTQHPSQKHVESVTSLLRNASHPRAREILYLASKLDGRP